MDSRFTREKNVIIKVLEENLKEFLSNFKVEKDLTEP